MGFFPSLGVVIGEETPLPTLKRDLPARQMMAEEARRIVDQETVHP